MPDSPLAAAASPTAAPAPQPISQPPPPAAPQPADAENSPTKSAAALGSPRKTPTAKESKISRDESFKTCEESAATPATKLKLRSTNLRNRILSGEQPFRESSGKKFANRRRRITKSGNVSTDTFVLFEKELPFDRDSLDVCELADLRQSVRTSSAKKGVSQIASPAEEIFPSRELRRLKITANNTSNHDTSTTSRTSNKNNSDNNNVDIDKSKHSIINTNSNINNNNNDDDDLVHIERATASNSAAASKSKSRRSTSGGASKPKVGNAAANAAPAKSAATRKPPAPLFKSPAKFSARNLTKLEAKKMGSPKFKSPKRTANANMSSIRSSFKNTESRYKLINASRFAVSTYKSTAEIEGEYFRSLRRNARI